MVLNFDNNEAIYGKKVTKRTRMEIVEETSLPASSKIFAENL